jgi:hypothetical protein
MTVLFRRDRTTPGYNPSGNGPPGSGWTKRGESAFPSPHSIRSLFLLSGRFLFLLAGSLFLGGLVDQIFQFLPVAILQLYAPGW